MILYTCFRYGEIQNEKKFNDWNEAIEYIRNEFKSNYFTIDFLVLSSGKVEISINDNKNLDNVKWSYLFEEVN